MRKVNRHLLSRFLMLTMLCYLVRMHNCSSACLAYAQSLALGFVSIAVFIRDARFGAPLRAGVMVCRTAQTWHSRRCSSTGTWHFLSMSMAWCAVDTSCRSAARTRPACDCSSPSAHGDGHALTLVCCLRTGVVHLLHHIRPRTGAQLAHIAVMKAQQFSCTLVHDKQRLFVPTGL